MNRRTALAAGLSSAGAALFPAGRLLAQTSSSGPVLTPEMFGAKGDGRTNDTEAFAALAARINSLGGGTVSMRRTTYIVGKQHPRRPGEHFGYTPQTIFGIRGCTRPVIVRGNGATLRCAPGLRFGTFDPETGLATRHPLPFTDVSELAIPYHGMVGAEGCSGRVEFSDLELDGNSGELRRGGPFGDAGTQVPGSGMLLSGNTGDEIVRNIYSHHHVQDGLMIDGPFDAAAGRRTRTIDNFRAEYNARQGCSIIGGRNYHFSNCRFAHTGKAGITSAPAAGVDIEAEDGRKVRDIRFDDCQFVDNSGPGMVADSGDSDGAQFNRCSFIGTTAWSCWPAKPNFHFRSCTFVGAVVRSYGHGEPDPTKATQYFDCTFTDDPRLSPTGQVWLPHGDHGTICDVALGDNTTFHRCTFRNVRGGLMPWSWRAIYIDCQLEQRSATEAYPKGRYIGTNTIRGPVDLSGVIVEGMLTVNGTVYRTGTRFGGAPSDAEWPRPPLQR